MTVILNFMHVWVCAVCSGCKVEWGMKMLRRCQVNLHKHGALLLSMKEETWNWTSTHREITTGGCIVHLKAVKEESGREENTSEDNSALQHGDSHTRCTQHFHKESSSGPRENFWGYHGNACLCVSVCVCHVTALPHDLLVAALT